MFKIVKKVWGKLLPESIHFRKRKIYYDYDFGWPGLDYRYLQSQPDLIALKALNHFYMNRELYLKYANDIHNTLGYYKEDIICSINREIERRIYVKFSSNYTVTDQEDHLWTRAAYTSWDPDVTPFSEQFNRTINSNLYKQEQINSKLEWEKFVQATSDKTSHFYSMVLGMTGQIVHRKILKQAYRSKMKEYHPDKFANSTEEEKIKREALSKKINEAYSYWEKKLTR